MMYENCPDRVVAAENVIRSVGVVNPELSSDCTLTVSVGDVPDKVNTCSEADSRCEAEIAPSVLLPVVLLDDVTVRFASSSPRTSLWPSARVAGTAEKLYRAASPTTPPTGIIDA